MLDPTNMYPDSFHPIAMGRSRDFRHKVKGYSRTRRPTRYLLIDLGLSRRYDPADGPPLDEPLHGGTGPHQNIKMARRHVTRFPLTRTTLGTWSADIIHRFASLALQRTFLTQYLEMQRVRLHGAARHRHGPRGSREAPQHG